MSDSENQGAKWELWAIGFVRPGPKWPRSSDDVGKEGFDVDDFKTLSLDYLNALEATIATLKAQLGAAEAKARMADGLRQWLRENEGDLFALGGALDQWIIDCDALSAPASDTGSEGA